MTAKRSTAWRPMLEGRASRPPVWAELPPSIDTRELLADALEENVAFVPGQSFYPDRSGHNTMRLNFSNVTPDRIEEGIARLGRAIKRRLARAAEAAGEGVAVSP